MTYGVGGLLVRSFPVQSFDRTPAFDLQLLDPEDFKYNIQEICDKCQAIILRCSTEGEAAALKRTAVNIILNGLDARVGGMMSLDHFFDVLRFIESELSPFLGMEAGEQKKLINSCFLMALELGEGEDSQKLWDGIVEIYKFRFDLEVIRQASKTFLNCCVDHVKASMPKAKACYQAINLCISFLQRSLDLSIHEGGEVQELMETYRGNERQFIMEIVCCAKEETALHILSKFVFNNPKWTWTIATRMIIRDYIEKSNFELTNLVEVTESWLRERLVNDETAKYISILLIRNLSALRRASYSSTRLTMHCLMRMPKAVQLTVLKEKCVEFSAVFIRFSAKGLEDITDVEWGQWGLSLQSADWQRQWLATLEKLGDLLSPFAHSFQANGQVIKGIHHFMMSFLVNGANECASLEIGTLERGLEVVDRTSGKYVKETNELSENIFEFIIFIKEKYLLTNLSETSWESFRSTLSRTMKIGLDWEDRICQYVIEKFSLVQEKMFFYMTDKVEDLISLMYKGKNAPDYAIRSTLLRLAESFPKSLDPSDFAGGENELTDEEAAEYKANLLRISFMLYKQALTNVSIKEFTNSQDALRIRNGIQSEDLSFEKAREIYKLATTNLCLLDLEMKSLKHALVKNYISRKEPQTKAEFKFLWNTIVGELKNLENEKKENYKGF